MPQDAALNLDPSRITRALGFDDRGAEWLRALSAIPSAQRSPTLPRAENATKDLLHLGLDPDDISAVAAAMPAPHEDPEIWWLLERCYSELVNGMGEATSIQTWQDLPDKLGDVGRFFYVYVFLAALPEVQAYHRSRQIPDSLSWAALSDLGARMRFFKRGHERAGFNEQFWLTLHFRGAIYACGRLQFNRDHIRFPTAGTGLDTLGLEEGIDSLGVHIPESGPLTPEECDESLAMARNFFDRYFPENGYRVATCSSWLMDPQLAEYLPQDSNIMRFQKRFHLVAGGEPGDEEIVRFIHARLMPVQSLPRRTTLERAVAAHLEKGNHWRVREGWLKL